MTDAVAEPDSSPAPETVTARARRDGVPFVNDSLTLLPRRDGTLQVGWHPDARFVLEPPAGVSASVMASVLRSMDGRRSIPEIYWSASELGVDASVLTEILAELERFGIVERRRPSPTRIAAVLVLGRGPLADAVAIGLSPGCRVARRHVTLPRDHAEFDCVVVADSVVCAPEVARALMTYGIAHLPVRSRDGTGVVGPLVLPGHTPCLECVELTRCDYDREWPHLAAQLLGSIGSASGPTVTATAAFAAAQVIQFTEAHAESPAPATIGHSIEVDTRAATTRRRRWTRHPLCSCGRR